MLVSGRISRCNRRAAAIRSSAMDTPAPEATDPDALVAVELDPANEALARPISFDARYGEGAGRTLVLGGGGVYFVAWQVAYLNGLIKRGVELSKPRSSSEHQWLRRRFDPVE